MFKTMNQNEMLCVNGGFYYVPVYDVTKYYRYVRGKKCVYGTDKKFVGTQQVASGSGISEIIRNTTWVYIG